MSEKIKEAVKVITDALKKDEGYYYGWQSNIAMSFVDEYFDKGNFAHTEKMYAIVHEIANNASKRFLSLLISEQNDEVSDTTGDDSSAEDGKLKTLNP